MYRDTKIELFAVLNRPFRLITSTLPRTNRPTSSRGKRWRSKRAMGNTIERASAEIELGCPKCDVSLMQFHDPKIDGRVEDAHVRRIMRRRSAVTAAILARPR